MGRHVRRGEPDRGGDLSYIVLASGQTTEDTNAVGVRKHADEFAHIATLHLVHLISSIDHLIIL
jgi:hypothetical protein